MLKFIREVATLTKASKIRNVLPGSDPTDVVTLGQLNNYGVSGVSYKKYVALLTQVGSNPPTAVILENTLGGIPVWTYSTNGTYIATLSGAFTSNKTALIISSNDGETAAAKRTSADAITVATYLAGVGTDDLLNGNTFEIIVYN